VLVHLLSGKEYIDDSTRKALLTELEKVVHAIADFEPISEGYICYMPRMNHPFKHVELLSIIGELRNGIEVAPKFLEFSKELSAKYWMSPY